MQKKLALLGQDPLTGDTEVVIFSEDLTKFFVKIVTKEKLTKLKQRKGYLLVGAETLPEGWWALKEVNKEEEL